MEKMFEEIEMGLDAYKSFAKVHEDGDVKDGVWSQVVCLNSPVIQNTTKEMGSRNSKY